MAPATEPTDAARLVAGRPPPGAIMNTVRQVIASKQHGAAIHSVPTEASVLTAVDAMSQVHIGALLVMENERIAGIVSERDVMTRVILQRRDPAKVVVGDIMTVDVVCIDHASSVEEAFAVMTDRLCRHLPVIENDRVVAVLSIGDLGRWVSQQQDFDVQMLHEFIEGRYPG
jgi:CBS domain-containing protein